MIRVILAGVSIECELSDLSGVMATVNPPKVPEPTVTSVIDQRIAAMGLGPKVAEPVKPTKIEGVKVHTVAEVFADWNIGDMIGGKERRSWYGHGLVKVDGGTSTAGFLGFLTFLRNRNPGRKATRAQLWEVFRFMPWTESTFIQSLCVAKHYTGWTYTDGVYVASK